MNYVFALLLFTFFTCTSSNSGTKILAEDPMLQEGTFIMMPDNEEASFHLDFESNTIVIVQNNKETTISLQPLFDYEEYYSAPKNRQILKDKTGIIHISKNVFNTDDAIEVLLQVAYNPPANDTSKPFVIDFLLSENGTAQLFGSTYDKTGQGSHPVFAIIDNQAYYGVYDDRRLGNFLYPHQKLYASPHFLEDEFSNGNLVYKKNSWEYSKAKGISVEETINNKKHFITRLIGTKEKALYVDHTIHYYFDNNTSSENVTVKMVETYNDVYYNPIGIRNLIEDLGECNSIKIIPVLMDYFSDDRNIDLPADDYGSTTIGILAEKALSKVFQNNPSYFINYNENYISNKLLEKWWSHNKKMYN